MELLKRLTNNDSINILAIKKLGDLQRQLSNNEQRISTLEAESNEYREQFSRVNIITQSLKAHIKRLTRQHEHLLQSLRVLGMVVKLLYVSNAGRSKMKKLQIVLSFVVSLIVQRTLMLDQIPLFMIPIKNRKIQIASQLMLFGCIFIFIKGNLENLFN